MEERLEGNTLRCLGSLMGVSFLYTLTLFSNSFQGACLTIRIKHKWLDNCRSWDWRRTLRLYRWEGWTEGGTTAGWLHPFLAWSPGPERSPERSSKTPATQGPCRTNSSHSWENGSWDALSLLEYSTCTHSGSSQWRREEGKLNSSFPWHRQLKCCLSHTLQL